MRTPLAKDEIGFFDQGKWKVLKVDPDVAEDPANLIVSGNIGLVFGGQVTILGKTVDIFHASGSFTAKRPPKPQQRPRLADSRQSTPARRSRASGCRSMPSSRSM
jgi:hypothetical protein